MPKKKKDGAEKKQEKLSSDTHILGAGEVMPQVITRTLETNYMPYVMSVILSRAIPEIDGFKPSHRKLLYTMYLMGLLTAPRTKSANIVGRTMQLNPHGDAAIYETMVRLTRGNEALLHPYIDGKGNFGKAYSKNMAYAASRYTEAKLDKICAELFRDIDKDTVDFVPNYDNSMREPTLFPVTFPNILVNSNTGIAVGMASSICSFNLNEVCETTIAFIKNPKCDIFETLKAPDFSGGGVLLYDRAKLDEIYNTGKGGIKVRAKYNYDKSNNCIDVTEIPPSTTSEAIIDKIIELVKSGKLKEISDVRDETDKSGLKITIDLKRGVNPDSLMRKLLRVTPLEDTTACNFNILVGGAPRVMGIAEILEEWQAFRTECVKRRTSYNLKKAEDRLHLLTGLQKILLDIDKAIKIIRNTEEESEVVPNLMIGFGIDETQAEYVAEIKLRHLNREYILKRLEDIEELKKTIDDMNEILSNKERVKKIIISELRDVMKKYGQPRKTEILYDYADDLDDESENVPDYPVHIFFTKEGYFKKVTPQSLRMSKVQKLKENDSVVFDEETVNSCDLIFFSDKSKAYKAKASDFPDTKTASLGDFIPAKLGFDEGESVNGFISTVDYKGCVLFFFENGKVAKVDMSAYVTKTNRKKLINAYSDKSPLIAAFLVKEDKEFIIKSTGGRALLFNSARISPKTTKNTQGVAVMTLKKGQRVDGVVLYKEGAFTKPSRYQTKTLPSAGAVISEEDAILQLTF